MEQNFTFTARFVQRAFQDGRTTRHCGKRLRVKFEKLNSCYQIFSEWTAEWECWLLGAEIAKYLDVPHIKCLDRLDIISGLVLSVLWLGYYYLS